MWVNRPKWLTARSREPILLLLVLLIACFFRFYRLANIPPIILGDEAVTAWQAMRILRGEAYPVIIPEDSGRMPMKIYLEAALFRVVGVSLHTARTVSALTGALTVIMLWVFVRALFSSNAGRAPRAHSQHPPSTARTSSVFDEHDTPQGDRVLLRAIKVIS